MSSIIINKTSPLVKQTSEAKKNYVRRSSLTFSEVFEFALSNASIELSKDMGYKQK